MPAYTLAQLHAFEDQFTGAVIAILTAGGITGAIGDGEDADLSDEIATVGFAVGPATGATALIPATALETISNRQEYNQFVGTLTIMYHLPRTRSSEAVTGLPGVRRVLGQKTGLIRSLFLRSLLPFDATNLPYLEVSAIVPQGTTYGASPYDGEEHQIDAAILSWQITFAIRRSAWPTAA